MAEKTYLYAGTMAEIPGSKGFWRKEASDDRWEEISGNGLPPDPQVPAIAIHPQNPDIVIIGTQRGVYKSLDRGDHWKRADFPEGRTAWCLTFRPDDPRIMYLGTNGDEVYRSDDTGDSWKYMSTVEIPDPIQMPFASRILGIAMEPKQPDVMYAVMEASGTARTLDAGKTWEAVNSVFGGNYDTMDQHGVVVGSPELDTVFIANRVGVWQSRDRGEHWENLNLDKFSHLYYSRGVYLAPNDPNTLYACVGLWGKEAPGDEGGVMRSTNGGATWERFDHDVTLGGSTMWVAINQRHPEQVYFAGRNGNVLGTDDGGATWKEHRLPESAQSVMSLACVSR
jgi:photosystem II stability/assembly factor-like uncharacterized protein